MHKQSQKWPGVQYLFNLIPTVGYVVAENENMSIEGRGGGRGEDRERQGGRLGFRDGHIAYACATCVLKHSKIWRICTCRKLLDLMFEGRRRGPTLILIFKLVILQMHSQYASQAH